MALRDYGMALSYHEVSNVGDNTIFGNGREIIISDNGREDIAGNNGIENISCDNVRENMTYDVQVNTSEEIYLLSASSSPDYVKHNHIAHPTTNFNRYNMRSSSKGGIENIPHSSPSRCTRKSQEIKTNKSTGKNPRKRAKTGKRKFSKIKIVPKSHKPAFKTKISVTFNSRSNLFPNSDDKELAVLGAAAETKRIISKLALPKLAKNQNIIKTKAVQVTHVTSPSHLTTPTATSPSHLTTPTATSPSHLTTPTATSPSHLTTPTATSTLLSMMADAVSVPKYTSVHASRSSTASDYQDYTARSTWPLLREMIAKPSVSVVSISPAPRQTLSTVLVDPLDSEEPKANVMNKLEKEIRCECKFNKGQPCWVLFQEDRLRKERLHHLTLKRESLDLVILAKIAANINREEKTKKYRCRDRQRCRVCYYHEGRQICRETFMFIHGICKGRLCALMQHYKRKGLSVRVHGNTSNVPHHALSYTDSERVLDFIREYANNHCISSFGRKSGSKAGGGLLIMSTTQSKLYVHHKYKMWCSRSNHRAVSLRSFQNLWTKHLPYIVVLRGSNKNPVPEQGREEAVLKLHDDIELMDEFVSAEMTSEKSSQFPVTSKVIHTSDTLKMPQSRQDDCVKNVHCGTNTDLEFYSDGRKKRKRKGIPPRRVDTSSCLPPISAGQDFGHNPNLNDSCLIHAPMGGIYNSFNNVRCVRDSSSDDAPTGGIHNSFNNVRSVRDSSSDDAPTGGIHNSFNSVRHVRDSSPDDAIIHSTLEQSDLHHSMFSSELHIPQDHPSAVINFNTQTTAASVRLTANRDMIYTYDNKTSISTSKAGSLHTSLYLSQPSQVTDSYSIQCSDRFVPQVSGSHGLGDQSQTLLLPQQGSDFSNMHQIDWQTWQTYSTL